MTATVLWIIAAILVIVGIVQIIQGQWILGIVLIVAGCLVGPGGYSIFHSRQSLSSAGGLAGHHQVGDERRADFLRSVVGP